MGHYRIACVEWSYLTQRGHRHIVAVGINSRGGNVTEQLVSVADVRTQIACGRATFYTQSPSTGEQANVEPYNCCGIQSLRSSPDAVRDNNLDNLGVCATR
jgi:hypothetical protein